MIDNLICKTCRGMKVIRDEHGKIVLCPKCQGYGVLNIPESYKEQNSNKKILLD